MTSGHALRSSSLRHLCSAWIAAVCAETEDALARGACRTADLPGQKCGPVASSLQNGRAAVGLHSLETYTGSAVAVRTVGGMDPAAVGDGAAQESRARLVAQRQGAVVGLVLPGRGLGDALSRPAAVPDYRARRADRGGRADRGRRGGHGVGDEGGVRPARRRARAPAADRCRLWDLVGLQAVDRVRDRLGAGAVRALRRPLRQGGAHLAARRDPGR